MRVKQNLSMGKLDIYKASAGSGKTFTLTAQYLKLLLENPLNYRRILAVTFTNKATAEMKSRILTVLNDLATATSNHYEELLREELQLDSAELKERASTAQQYILHNYAHFSVMTLDSFFQTIIKSFMKDIGIQFGYAVELDTDTILDAAIERMLEQVEKRAELKEWLLNFIQEKIDRDKSWNIKYDIQGLRNDIFGEEIRMLGSEEGASLRDKKFLKTYIARLDKLIKSFEKELADLGKRAMNCIRSQNLSITDFAYGNLGVAAYLNRLANGLTKEAPTARTLAAYGDASKWYAKKASKEKIAQIESIVPELTEIVGLLIATFEQNKALYNSANLIKDNLYLASIIADIIHYVREIADEQNVVFLTESNKLLADLIAGNEVPFIYEKIGTRYQHFMLDEFQDTSKLQWANLRPLVENSLAEGNQNLIVGDVKQAIYRWRNGDLDILANGLASDFHPETLAFYELTRNWRSSKRVIDFNNELYAAAPLALQNHYNASLEEYADLKTNRITQIYESSQQEYPRQLPDQGCVRISFVQKNKDENWTDQALEKLPAMVEELQQSGYQAEDIVFLVRDNKQVAPIVAHFMAYVASEQAKPEINYEILSDGALLLKNALCVRVLETALLSLLNPEEKLYHATLLQLYRQYLAENETENLPQSFEQLVAEQYQGYTSLIELTERIIASLQLGKQKGELVFIQTFQELVLQFQSSPSTSLPSFVEWWETKKDSIRVASVNNKAMRILTVHKAKGLEFKAVILPFANWEINPKRIGDRLWATSETELSFMKKTLVNYNNLLGESYFYKDYYEEELNRYIDTLNILYVATTRAEEVLFIQAEKKGTVKELKTISDLLWHLLQVCPTWKADWNEETQEYQSGKPSVAKESEQEQKETRSLDYYNYHDYNSKLTIKHSVADFHKEETPGAISPVRKGLVLHRLLQEVQLKEDLEQAFAKLYFEGLIEKKDIPEIKKQLTYFGEHKTLRDLFLDKWTVLNERPIIANHKKYVPDRVLTDGKKTIVVDYKFGKIKEPKHQKQVQKYIQLLTTLNYQNVKGILVYSELNEIEEVLS